jgi:hypothetical protein
VKSKEGVVSIALKEIHLALIELERKGFNRLWAKDVDARVRRLSAILEQAGFVQTGDLTPFLDDDFIEGLANLAKGEALIRIEDHPAG